MQSCPPIRKYQVDVSGTGADTVRFGETHPNLLGWELSYQTTHGTNYSQVLAIVECNHPLWYKAAKLSFGDQNAAPSFTQGGVLYVPFPVVNLSFYDGEGIGNATVQIVGRPVMMGDISRASTELRTAVPWQVDASSNQNVSVPKNACAFAVTRSDISASSISVSSAGLDNETFQVFSIGKDTVNPGAVTPMPWRETPWMDKNSQGVISITNNDGTNGAKGQVYFLFDLSKGR